MKTLLLGIVLFGLAWLIGHPERLYAFLDWASEARL